MMTRDRWMNAMTSPSDRMTPRDSLGSRDWSIGYWQRATLSLALATCRRRETSCARARARAICLSRGWFGRGRGRVRSLV